MPTVSVHCFFGIGSQNLRQFQSELEGSPDRRRMTFRMASSKSMLESHFLVEAEKKRK